MDISVRCLRVRISRDTAYSACNRLTSTGYFDGKYGVVPLLTNVGQPDCRQMRINCTS